MGRQIDDCIHILMGNITYINEATTREKDLFASRNLLGFGRSGNYSLNVIRNRKSDVMLEL